MVPDDVIDLLGQLIEAAGTGRAAQVLSRCAAVEAEDLQRAREGQGRLADAIVERLRIDGRSLVQKAELENQLRLLMRLGITETQIAQEAGVNVATVSRLLSAWEGSAQTIQNLENALRSLLRQAAKNWFRMSPTWSDSRGHHQQEDKKLIGEYWASQEFMVTDPKKPARDTVGSALVPQGTTQAAVVEKILDWLQRQTGVAYHITWYVAGTLVADKMRQFQRDYPHLRSAARLFFLPGDVDLEREAVLGPAAVEFAQKLARWFRYALLSSHSFDLRNGQAYFQFNDEVELLSALARRQAKEKILFLDRTKFRPEGVPGYTVRDLLEGAERVTICTVSTEADDARREAFNELAEELLEAGPGEQKCLRLCLVKSAGTAVVDERTGVLK